MNDILRLARGGGINFLGALIGQILNYFFLVYLTRFLGAEQSGLFILGLTIVTISGILSLLGLNQGLVRYLAIYARNDDQAAICGTVQMAGLIVTGLSLGTALVLIVGANQLAFHLFNEPSLVPIIQVMSWSVPFYSLMLLFNSASRAHKIMRYTMIVESFWRPAGLLFLSGLAVWLGFELMGVAVAYVITLILACGLALYLMLRVVPLFQSVNTSVETGTLLRFSTPLLLMNVVTYAMAQVETLLLGALTTTTEVSIYYTAWRTAAIGVLIHVALANIFAPFVSELHYHGDIVKLDELFKMVTRWGVTFSLPFLSVLALFAGPIMMVFGEQFAAGDMVLTILALGLIINVTVGPSGMLLVMSGYSKIDTFNVILLFVLRIALAFLLIPRFGLLGAAVGGAGLNGLVNVLRLGQVYILNRIHPYETNLLKPYFAALFTTLLIFTIKKWMIPVDNLFFLFSYIILFFAVYALMIWGLGIDSKDIKVINVFFKRVSGIMHLTSDK